MTIWAFELPTKKEMNAQLLSSGQKVQGEREGGGSNRLDASPSSPPCVSTYTGSQVLRCQLLPSHVQCQYVHQKSSHIC